MKRKYSLSLIMIVASFCVKSQTSTLLLNAHSHNDYEQENPLFNAITNGFTSIEVDVHYRKNCLKVSHVRHGLKKKKDLEELYLVPLDSLVSLNKGTVFPEDSTQLVLMIELKTKKKKSFLRLLEYLSTYDHLFQKRLETGSYRWGPIVLLITGNPPKDLWIEKNSPYLNFDARIGRAYPSLMEEQTIMMNSNIRQVVCLKKLL